MQYKASLLVHLQDEASKYFAWCSVQRAAGYKQVLDLGLVYGSAR